MNNKQGIKKQYLNNNDAVLLKEFLKNIALKHDSSYSQAIEYIEKQLNAKALVETDVLLSKMPLQQDKNKAKLEKPQSHEKQPKKPGFKDRKTSKKPTNAKSGRTILAFDEIQHRIAEIHLVNKHEGIRLKQYGQFLVVGFGGTAKGKDPIPVHIHCPCTPAICPCDSSEDELRPRLKEKCRSHQ